MLTTVEGVFKDGQVELREEPPAVDQARVIVTFLPEGHGDDDSSTSTVNRRMLDLLRAWQDEPLSREEETLLDDFDAFQGEHPLGFARLDEDP